MFSFNLQNGVAVRSKKRTALLALFEDAGRKATGDVLVAALNAPMLTRSVLGQCGRTALCSLCQSNLRFPLATIWFPKNSWNATRRRTQNGASMMLYGWGAIAFTFRRAATQRHREQNLTIGKNWLSFFKGWALPANIDLYASDPPGRIG